MCCGGGGGGADPNVGAAALAQANLSREQLEWAKSIYAEQAPSRAEATRRANLTSDAQLEAMKKQTALTDDYAAYQKNTFRPLEEKIVAEAQDYATPARIQSEVAKAGATYQAASDNAQSQQTRNLNRMGVNPSSGRALAMGNQSKILNAAGLAGAMNGARDKTELQGYARKMDAANMGRGLSSSQATSAGVALNQGNSAVANGMQSGAINAQGNSIMQNGFSGASNSMASAGSLYGQNAQLANQANASGNSLMSSLGQVGGMMMMASDVRMKTSIKSMNPDAALQAVNSTPVSEWKYKKGSSADDGGKEHIGPMAQDVQATMGDEAAPNGTAIDLITMNGVTMAAIQALSKKVDRLSGPRGMRRSA